MYRFRFVLTYSLMFENVHKSSNIEADRPLFLRWWSVEECGGVRVLRVR